MSDEMNRKPTPGITGSNSLHWNGPRNRQWPQALQRGVPEELPIQPVPPQPIPEETPSLPEEEPIPAEESKKKKRRREEKEKFTPAFIENMEKERQYRPIRFRRDGRTGLLGGLLYVLFILCAGVALACFAWMSAADVLALNKPDSIVELTLPESIFADKEVEVEDEDGNVTGTKVVRAADIDAVAGILHDYGLINYKWLFKLYSGFSEADVKLEPGTYKLNTNLDYRALVTKMRVGSGAQLQTLVMFPEGFNQDQIFARMEENGVCKAADLYEAAASTEYSYSFLNDIEYGDPYRLQGFLYPDSYYFYQGMQASSALNKFLSNMHYKLTEEMRQQAQAMNLTMQEVMTIASLIEKEAGHDDERPLIASVIYNRLAAGMPLQFDSTVTYIHRDEEDFRISSESIQASDDPYNTYLYTGLPPGPICNPGIKSIQAALNPATTKYLFFAQDMETDSMQFFIYQDEHEAFVATQNYG